jgi:hypothetical protein
MKYFIYFAAICFVTAGFPAKQKNLKEDKAFEAWQKSMESSRIRTNDRNRLKMALRVKELATICELSEDQLKRLELAAKGAIERASDAYMEYQEKSWRRRREGNNNRGGIVLKRETHDPTQQEIWQDIITETLNLDQLKSYHQEMSARAMFYAETTIYRLMQQLDEKARMSASQRDMIKKQIQSSIKIPEKDMDMQAVQTIVYSTFAQFPEKPLREILNKEQFKQWVSFGQRYGWKRKVVGKAPVKQAVKLDAGVGIKVEVNGVNVIKNGIIVAPDGVNIEIEIKNNAALEKVKPPVRKEAIDE